MTGVVIYRWTAPFRGRELEAMRFAADSEAGFQKLMDDGVIERYEWVIGHTGSGEDMVIVWGDMDTLHRLMESEEMELTRAQGAYLLKDFRYDFGVAGTKAADVYAAWGRTLMEHAAHATA